jgi:hemerythrin-like domain-containing protein
MSNDDKQTSLAFPGHYAPVASFDDPIAMLFECHNRVRRSLELLQKMNERLKAKGGSTHNARAASDVLRYFDVAAPLHHQDEELHVFPFLRKSNVVAIQTYVNRVQTEHQRMDEQWSVLRGYLRDFAVDVNAQWSQAFEDCSASFQLLYKEHLSIEEQLLFPALTMRVTPEELENMGVEMQQRRRETPLAG